MRRSLHSGTAAIDLPAGGFVLARAVTFADRLAEEADRAFVGRGAEIALFGAALDGTPPPFAVLHLFGPGGIGKTTLLRRFADMAGRAGAAVVLLSGPELEPSPAIFEAVVAGVLGFDPHTAPPERRIVLLLDGYESLAPLDDWLRRRFIPSLPPDAIVVIAGRGDPAPGWITEPGWAALCRRVALRGFDPGETDEFLSRRGVLPEHRPALAASTFGFPLALTLAADSVVRTGGIDPGDRADITRALIARVIGEAPSPLHRSALQCACRAWRTDEALLADAVDGDAAPALLDWLRSLPFMDVSTEGVFPHDIIRDLVDGDHRWRDPLSFRTLHRRVAAHYHRRLGTGTPGERLRALRETVFLHRVNPVMADYFKFRTFGRILVEPARPDDREAIVAMVERFEGPHSAGIARYWLQRQPEAFHAAREGDHLSGFICHLDLTRTNREDAAADPALAALAPILGQAAPRPGEGAVFGRFIAATETYQAPSPTLSALQISSFQTWMTPRLSWAFVCTNAEIPWHDLMRYVDFAPVVEVAVNGCRHRVFGHDWRRVPPEVWFAMMEEREVDPDMQPATIPAMPPEFLVLSRPVFGEAVRDALKSLGDESALTANPLLRSRLLAGGAGTAGLRDLIARTAAPLAASPRDEKFHRALDLTYLRPIGKQEAVAERLGVPFGTYRYRLNTAIERVVEALWSRELEAAPPA